MDWFYFIAFELVLPTALGVIGTCFLWLSKKPKISFGLLLSKYGFIIGGIGALIFSLFLIVFFWQVIIVTRVRMAIKS
jgi:hypothetical protein